MTREPIVIDLPGTRFTSFVHESRNGTWSAWWAERRR